MPRGLGAVQQKILQGLREDRDHEAPLIGIAYYIGGQIELLEDDWPREPPSPTVYSAVARAVQALERRGLVKTKTTYYWRGYRRWEDCFRELRRYRDKRGREYERKPGHPCPCKTVALAETPDTAAR